MTIDVYWSRAATDIKDFDHSQLKISSLYSHIVDDQFRKNAGQYLQCPAATREMQNTFVVTADSDISWQIDNNKVPRTNNHISTVSFHDEIPMIALLSSYLVIFSEHDVIASVLPPYMHHGSHYNENVKVLPGSYNISKWFRPLHPAFYHNNPSKVSIKKSQPLFYVKLNTDQKINLIQYKFTPKINKIMYDCLTYKDFEKGKNLSYLYNKWQSHNYTSKLISLIKDNIIDDK